MFHDDTDADDGLCPAESPGTAIHNEQRSLTPSQPILKVARKQLFGTLS